MPTPPIKFRHQWKSPSDHLKRSFPSLQDLSRGAPARCDRGHPDSNTPPKHDALSMCTTLPRVKNTGSGYTLMHFLLCSWQICSEWEFSEVIFIQWHGPIFTCYVAVKYPSSGHNQELHSRHRSRHNPDTSIGNIPRYNYRRKTPTLDTQTSRFVLLFLFYSSFSTECVVVKKKPFREAELLNRNFFKI